MSKNDEDINLIDPNLIDNKETNQEMSKNDEDINLIDPNLIDNKETNQEMSKNDEDINLIDSDLIDNKETNQEMSKNDEDINLIDSDLIENKRADIMNINNSISEKVLDSFNNIILEHYKDEKNYLLIHENLNYDDINILILKLIRIITLKQEIYQLILTISKNIINKDIYNVLINNIGNINLIKILNDKINRLIYIIPSKNNNIHLNKIIKKNIQYYKGKINFSSRKIFVQ